MEGHSHGDSDCNCLGACHEPREAAGCHPSLTSWGFPSKVNGSILMGNKAARQNHHLTSY